MRSTRRGERRLFRFSAAAGDLVYVVSSRTGQVCTGAAHQIFTAAGDAVSGEPFICADIERTQLPSTGEYDLVVSSWDGGVGSYTDTLIRVPPDVVEPVAVPGTVTGEITVAGSAVRYTFDGAAGDQLALDGRGPDTTGVAYRVEGPGGAVVSGSPFAMSDTTVTLPATGTYALVVSSYSRRCRGLHDRHPPRPVTRRGSSTRLSRGRRGRPSPRCGR